MICRPKDEVSPSSANMHEFIPPVFMFPFKPPEDRYFILQFWIIAKMVPIEIKYVEK